MVASNTKDCFRECVGKHIKGVLFDALPASRADLREGNKTLIFDDGSGLTIANNGSFWLERADEIARAIDRRSMELKQTERGIKEVLAAAGTR